MKTFKDMLKLIEEAENDPNTWLSEGFEFVEIDHVSADKQELAEAGDVGYKMIKWTAKDEGEGPVKVTDELQRRKMLEQGWRDVLKIEKFESDDKYTQREIDPRFYESYFKADGWKKGWTNYCIAKDGERKYVKPQVHSAWLAKGWHDYDKIKISRKVAGKKGDKYEITFIDSAEFPKYEAEGWKMGWEQAQENNKSFSIQTSNSKLGKHVANFSLTPVTSCPKGVPCASDGCYARKCYEQYPAAQAAWDHNFELLRAPSGPKWLEEDVNNFLQNGPGKNLTKFRWHVAGDLIDAGHLAAICNIAAANPKVLFWLYTKNYGLVEGCNPPQNLVIILSAWNDYQLEKIEKMHKKFPVAYLDDWDHKDLIPKDEDAFICPCADDKVGDMVDDKHCETCKTHSERHGKTDTHPCYMLKAGESLIFRKH